MFAVVHICIYAYDFVYMHCVRGHALHSDVLERCYFVCTLQRPLVHLSLEAKL